MKQRKRRRTMRPPLYIAENATPTYLHKRRSPERRLCVNGACSVYGSNDVPSCFSDSDKSEHLECSSEGLKVSYQGPGAEDKDAASIRTDVPIPSKRIGMYYFEITIRDKGDTGRIGIGLCERKVKLEKMPGWENGSYAFHGDDGLLFKEDGQTGLPYGPKYGTDDIIGCCWDFVSNEVFFTLNGDNLGKAFINLSGTFYPTIGMQSKGGVILANFGAEPFKFDIEACANQQREKVLSFIMSRKLDRDYLMMSDTVLSYLMHNGYSKTAAAFSKDAGREQLFRAERELMMKRQVVCEKVVNGDIDGAIADVEKQFPEVLEQHLSVCFLLHTQKCIDMIVSGSGLEAVEYGRKELSRFRSVEVIKAAELQDGEHGGMQRRVPYADVLKDVYLLLAFGDPTKCPAGYLTRRNRREMVADRLNSAILATQGRPMRSVLERFICQSRAVLSHLLQMGNGSAAFVSEQDIL